MLIFQQSNPGRVATAQIPTQSINGDDISDLPQNMLRQTKPILPEVSELQVVRHYTKLSQKNFSIDTHFYPLGSCTMKYNPRGVHRIASLPGFLNRHPLASLQHSQGYLHCGYQLQRILQEITGMKAVSLAPMAGAQGELAGVAMIRAYHHARGDTARTEILIPDAAHGTNPASAVACGYKVREIATGKDGDVDLEELKKVVGPQTAGIMLTNPSTLGVFGRHVHKVAKIIHESGGLLYYDGANLNAILGKVKPGDMGFDVMHINLHKTFATPHGGGGPGAGPIAVSQRLVPFLPVPMIASKSDSSAKKNRSTYSWLTEQECPQTIGRLSAFMGNAAVILRAMIYIRMLGHSGLHQVAELATLNANYLMTKLEKVGFTLAYPNRRASHEFIVTLTKEAKAFGISATDVAKRLLDYGFHAPTIYFPLLIPECLLIEPTETETKQEIDAFVDAMAAILAEMKSEPQKLKQAPHSMPVGRLDDVKAARDLDLIWKAER